MNESVVLRVWKESGVQVLLDVKGKQNIPTTYQFQNVLNFGKAEGDYMKQLDLPATKNNIAFFGELWNANLQGTFNHKKKLKMVMEFKTIPILKGFMQLVDVKVEKGKYAEFTVKLFGESVSLFKDFGNKLLKDVDWSAFDHSATLQNVADGMDGIIGQENFFSDDLQSGIVLGSDGTSGEFFFVDLGDNIDYLDSGDGLMVIRTGDTGSIIYYAFDTVMGEEYEIDIVIGSYTYTSDSTIQVRDHGTDDILWNQDFSGDGIQSITFIATGTISKFMIITDGFSAGQLDLMSFEIRGAGLGDLADIGVVYGIQDYGDQLRAEAIDVENDLYAPSYGLIYHRLKPYINTKKMLDVMMQQVGWTYESDFINDAYFNKVHLLAHNLGKELSFNTGLFHISKVGITSDQYMETGFNQNGVLFDDESSFDFSDTNNVNQAGAGLSGIYTGFVAEYNSAGQGGYRFRISLRFTGGDGNGGEVVIYLMRRFGGTEFTMQSWNLVVPADSTGDEREFLEETNTFIQSGDYYLLMYNSVISNPFSPPPMGLFSLIASEHTFFECFQSPVIPLVSVPNTYDYPFHLSDNIGQELKQKDILAFLDSRFNLMYIPSKTKEKHVRIEPWNTYMAVGVRKDWSNKIDLSKTYVIKTLADSEKETIEFNTKQGEDIINKLVKDNAARVYGRQKFVNDLNDFATGETKIVSPDVVSPLNALAGSDIMIPRLYTESGTPVKPELRFFVKGESIDIGDYKLRDYHGNDVTRDHYTHFGHYSEPIPDSIDEDLNFGKESPFHAYVNLPSGTCYERYWKAYLDQTYGPEARLLTCHIDLSAHDIEGFEWNDKVYLLGAWWNVNKITGFDPTNGGTTMVEFVRRSNQLSGLTSVDAVSDGLENSYTLNLK